MDPLHPLVQIQPPAPTPPEYNRVQRIEPDQQRESAPDWQRHSDEGADDEAEEQFEDDYDPDWSDPAASEPYGPAGLRQDPGPAGGLSHSSEQSGDRRRQGERRAHPPAGADDPGEDPGPHIDISA